MILVPDKTEQLNLRLKPLEAEIQISSTPRAQILLDGNAIGTTPLVSRVKVGKYSLEFRKKDYILVKKNVIVKPFEKNRVKAQLISLPKLHITSTPSGADVLLDNKYQGKTPLALKKPPGRFTVRIKKEGYEDHKEIIKIKKHGMNRVRATLLKMVTLELKVSPPDASVTVDGKFVGGEEPVTYENYKDFTDMDVQLPEGQHTVHVSHHKAKKTVKFNVKLKSRMTQRKIRLRMKSSYVNQLKNSILETKLTAWRWKLGSVLAGSILASLYAQQQSGLAVEAKDQQDKYIQSMMAAPSYESASDSNTQVVEQQDLIKQHNANMQTGMLISAALAEANNQYYFF